MLLSPLSRFGPENHSPRPGPSFTMHFPVIDLVLVLPCNSQSQTQSVPHYVQLLVKLVLMEHYYKLSPSCTLNTLIDSCPNSVIIYFGGCL